MRAPSLADSPEIEYNFVYWRLFASLGSLGTQSAGDTAAPPGPSWRGCVLRGIRHLPGQPVNPCRCPPIRLVPRSLMVAGRTRRGLTLGPGPKGSAARAGPMALTRGYRMRWGSYGELPCDAGLGSHGGARPRSGPRGRRDAQLREEPL